MLETKQGLEVESNLTLENNGNKGQNNPNHLADTQSVALIDKYMERQLELESEKNQFVDHSLWKPLLLVENNGKNLSLILFIKKQANTRLGLTRIYMEITKKILILQVQGPRVRQKLLS